MGGTAVSLEIMKNESVGYFNALVVSAMMGCTISFNLPFSISVVDKSQHSDLFFGMLCGVATIPLGCFIGGLIYGVSIGALLIDLLPLIIFSAIIVLGILFFPNVSIRIFKALGWVMTAVITLGLVFGSINYLFHKEVIKGLETIEEAGIICLNASIVLSGAFCLMFVVSKLMKKPLSLLAKKINVNEASAMGFLSTVITNATTYGNMKHMDRKGVILNSAFAVSAPFTFGGHLAFTMIYSEEAVLPMIIGKLSAGIFALILAFAIIKKRNLSCNEESNVK
jgi:ethanolamine transporter